MSYTTLRKNDTKIPDSLNDPYNTSSYRYAKEEFVPFNFGNAGSGQAQVNSQVAQQQAQQQQQIIQMHKQQQQQLQDEQNVQNVQRVLHLQLIERAQAKDADTDLRVIHDLNKEINELDNLIALNRHVR